MMTMMAWNFFKIDRNYERNGHSELDSESSSRIEYGMTRENLVNTQ